MAKLPDSHAGYYFLRCIVLVNKPKYLKASDHHLPIFATVL